MRLSRDAGGASARDLDDPDTEDDLPERTGLP